MTKDKQQLIKNTISMAWPTVMESFFIALAGMVDTWMVSSIGPEAVAAVGLTTQPKFLGLALFIATNIAVSALVARRRGEKKQENANQILQAALIFTVVAGVIISALCVAFANPIIRLSGSEEATHADAVAYFRIIMGGMLFNIISLVINSAQRGAGNTKIAMCTNVVSNLINIICNYLLIQGNFGFPALGIRGAAVATVFGSMVACVMSIISILPRNQFLSIRLWSRQRINEFIQTLIGIFKISYSTFIEQVLLRIGFMSVSIMAAKQGTDAFAAHQVGMNVMALSFSFGDGMQAAAVALIGQSLGRREIEQAKAYGRISQRIGNVISIVLSIIYLTCGELYYQMYFDDAVIIEIGVSIMQLMVVIVLLQIVQVIYMGCLRGAGDVAFTAFASAFSVTIVRPVMSYVFCYLCGYGIIGIWYGVLCDQICRVILTTVRFKSGKWTKIVI